MLKPFSAIATAALAALFLAGPTAASSPPPNPAKGLAAAPSADADAAATLPGRPCADDEPCWNWTTMGNRRRGVVTMWGTPLVVSPHRYCLLARHHNLSPGLPKLRGDFTARRTAC